MTCGDFEKLIALDVEGDLAAPQAERVTAHLEACRTCRKFQERLRASQAMFKSVAQEAPDEATLQAVRRGVLNRLPAERTPLAFPLWQFAVGVGVTAILILALVMHRRPTPAPSPISASTTESKPTLEVARTSPPTAPAPLRRRARSEGAAKFHAASRRSAASAERGEPLTVKLITGNPNIIIYWQVE